MNKLYYPVVSALALLSVVLITLPVIIGTETETVSRDIPAPMAASPQNLSKPEAQRSFDPRLSPLRVSLLFTTAQKKPSAEPRIENIVPAEQKQTQTATWLKKLGTIRDVNGTMRLYFKDSRSGSLIRVRTDGTEENGYRLTTADNGSNAIETPEGLFFLTGEQ